MENNEEEIMRDGGSDSLQDTQADYIDALKQLKANSVSKEEYDRVKAENRRLLNDVINGATDYAQETKLSDKPDINVLRKELFDRDGSLTNLDYVSKALQLRQAVMDDGGEDPFLPIGRTISPTDEDRAVAKKLANGLQHCVDFAEGNPDLFTAELQRITIESPMAMRSRQNNNLRR